MHPQLGSNDSILRSCQLPPVPRSSAVRSRRAGACRAGQDWLYRWRASRRCLRGGVVNIFPVACLGRNHRRLRLGPRRGGTSRSRIATRTKLGAQEVVYPFLQEVVYPFPVEVVYPFPVEVVYPFPKVAHPLGMARAWTVPTSPWGSAWSWTGYRGPFGWQSWWVRGTIWRWSASASSTEWTSKATLHGWPCKFGRWRLFIYRSCTHIHHPSPTGPPPQARPLPPIPPGH